LASSGTYDVYLWWPTQQAAYAWASNAPVDIVGSSGSSAVLVNQRLNGGNWVLVGSCTFATGTSGCVRVRTDGTTGYVIADAVKFVPRGIPNLAPVVSAGPDGTTQNQVEYALNGAVSDDGIPAGSPLTSLWSVVSGPGSVTFKNASSAKTSAVFSKAGLYTLRLTASDGQKTSSDEATFDVKYQSPKKPRTVN
jgi:hypothetical protein